MYIKINDQPYNCIARPTISDSMIKLSLDSTTLPDTSTSPSGGLRFFYDNDFEMRNAIELANYKYWWLIGNVLTISTTTQPVVSPVTVDLAAYKLQKISESKTALNAYLSANPLKWTNDKYYTITEDHQNRLSGLLMSYQIATALNQTPDVLKWNATGEECTEWEFTDLGALALAIKRVVESKVSIQQTYEVQVNACESIEAINALTFDYTESEGT